MIKKYRFGTPIDTEAVVKQLSICTEDVSYFKLEKNEKIVLTYQMTQKDYVYGLGENVRGINKRGWHYVSKCSDEPNHSEDRESLYGAHNFIVVDGKETFGLFIDFPGIVTYDIGFSSMNDLSITIDGVDADLYIIKGDSVLDIVHQFRELIGQSYLAPKWAFGYGQSRWSYMNAKEVTEVADRYQNAGIPIDSIYLDIDYMEKFKDFTINDEAFPEFEQFVAEMKKRGIHLVPIIDAGVKEEPGYDVYEEGVKNNFFCKKEDGTDFRAAVWPGIVHFPDFLNKDARKWFGMKYKILMDMGIEGFWNDMNEPAIFYTVDRLEEVFKEVKKYDDPNLGVYDFWTFRDLGNSLQNNTEDYKRFYHNMNGKKVRHDQVHNLYGYNMTRAAKEAFDEINPEQRTLIFSRASYIGMHRFGGIWMGDNQSIWSHLLLNLKMLPSLNMCGFMYTGADLGGFGGNASEDLVLRWLSLGIFTPLMRNHAALGTRQQELYQFENVEVCKKILDIRYGLIPYLYSEYMKATIRNEMMFIPLGFVYKDDEMAKQVEDQLLVGDSIMIAPVYQQNQNGRYVYLPENMRMLRMKSLDEVETMEYGKGHHYIQVGLDEIVFFIRQGKVLPMANAAKNVADIDDTKLKLYAYGDLHTAYEFYTDNGYSNKVSLDENIVYIHVENGKAIASKEMELTVC